MKDIAMILVGAFIIALVLGFGVYHYFGDETGYYFALLIAVPAGLGSAGVLYLVYTAVRSRRKKL